MDNFEKMMNFQDIPAETKNGSHSLQDTYFIYLESTNDEELASMGHSTQIEEILGFTLASLNRSRMTLKRKMAVLIEVAQKLMDVLTEVAQKFR